MIKRLLLLALLLSLVIFASCETGTTYPEVTDQQAAAAVLSSTQAMSDSDILTAIVTNTLAGGCTTAGTAWAVSVSATGESTITFTSFDISTLTADEYDSLSGTISINGNDVIFNLTFSGGPVITFYYKTVNNIATELTVNGHDMSHLL